MKLLKFRIKNYKSILDLEDCNVENKVTVLAGKNESGKTNILEGLFKLRVGEQFEEKDKTLGHSESPQIEATFQMRDSDITEIINFLKEKYSVQFSEQQIDGLKKQNCIY